MGTASMLASQRHRIAPLALTLAVACGGTQKHAEGPATGAPATQAQCAPTATAAPSPPQESLVELIPDRAVAAAIIRKNALAPLRTYLDSDPGQRDEIASYLTRTVGVDFTRVEGAVAFSLSIGAKPTAAVILRMPAGTDVPPLKLPRTSSYAGVDVVRISNDAVAASLPGALVVGSEPEVAAAITRVQGKGAAVSATAPLAVLLEPTARDADVVLAVHGPSLSDPQVAALAANFGIVDALLAFDATPQPGHLVIKLSGDGQKLASARDLVMQQVQIAVAELQKERDAAVQGANVAKGLGAISTFHTVRRLSRELEPKIEGNALVIRYELPRLEGPTALAVVAGALAAIAVPNFQKYLARSKTSEARANLRALQIAVASYYEEHKKAGKKFAFPPSTSWSPAAPCCGQPDNKCAVDASSFSAPAWKAFSFTMESPHYFQYRFTSEGKGETAKYKLEARADLDCDGEYSTYSVEGHVDPAGALVTGEISSSNELE